MMERAQAAFEYLLMIAGCVLMASLVIIMVRGAMGTANNAIAESTKDYLHGIRCVGGVCPLEPTPCPTNAACSAQKETQPPAALLPF